MDYSRIPVFAAFGEVMLIIDMHDVVFASRVVLWNFPFQYFIEASAFESSRLAFCCALVKLSGHACAIIERRAEEFCFPWRSQVGLKG